MRQAFPYIVAIILIAFAVWIAWVGPLHHPWGGLFVLAPQCARRAGL